MYVLFVILSIGSVIYTLDKINDFTGGQIDNAAYTIKARRLLKHYEFEKLAKRIVIEHQTWEKMTCYETDISPNAYRLTKATVQELFSESKDSAYEKKARRHL